MAWKITLPQTDCRQVSPFESPFSSGNSVPSGSTIEIHLVFGSPLHLVFGSPLHLVFGSPLHLVFGSPLHLVFGSQLHLVFGSVSSAAAKVALSRLHQ